MKILRGYKSDSPPDLGDDSSGPSWVTIIGVAFAVWLACNALVAPRSPGRSGLLGIDQNDDGDDDADGNDADGEYLQ